jgi:hypothetical protein
LIFSLEMGPVFHQFKPLQSPMLANSRASIASHCPPRPRRRQWIKLPLLPRPKKYSLALAKTAASRDRARQCAIGSATARRDTSLGPDVDRSGCRRDPRDGTTLPSAGHASRKGRPRAGMRAKRHAPRSEGRAVGSSSARRRGNHRFQSRLCRVGILGSVSPSNEC